MLIFNDENFEKLVQNQNGPVLVDFWAPWCGPCIQFIPILEELNKKYKRRVVIGKVNVDENEIQKKFSVLSIPTLILFKDGNEQQRVVGRKSIEELSSIIDNYL